jgi:quinol monooxygenase YgiN
MSGSHHDADALTGITFINRFRVHGPPAEFELTFERVADFLRTQDGFIRYTLLRHVRREESEVGSYVNVAHWRDLESFQRALGNPDIGNLISELHKLSTSEPSFYRTRLAFSLGQAAGDAAEPSAPGAVRFS